VVRLSPQDNVVIAIDAVGQGMQAADMTAQQRIPRGHKMAIEPIGEGAPVKKFGQVIGFASRGIGPGEWVHEHNVTLHDFARDYRIGEDAKNDEGLPPELRATFEGYVGPGGGPGTRDI